MIVNSKVLGVLDALSGSIVLVCKKVVHISQKRKTKRDTTGKSKDFSYEVVRSHSRWIKIDKKYIMYRELKIRSKVSGLSEMQIGVGPTSNASYEVESLTPLVKLDCIQPPPSDLVSEDYRVIFPTALSKGETLRYKIKIHAVAKRGRSLPQCFTLVKD